MTADRDHLRFYVDESALGLGKALEAARRTPFMLDTSSFPNAHSACLTLTGFRRLRLAT